MSRKSTIGIIFLVFLLGIGGYFIYGLGGDITLLYTIPILLVVLFVVLLIGFKKRKAPILRMFGSTYFTFEMIDEAGMSKYVNRTTADLEHHGKVVLFKYKNGKYKVQEDRVFFRNNIPCSIYREGNPLPLNVMGAESPEIAVYDEDKKTMVKVLVSAQELKDSIESQVVHNLHKLTASRIEMILIIVSIIGIIIQFIVLYEIVQVNASYSNLIGQLNVILQHIQTQTTTTGVP